MAAISTDRTILEAADWQGRRSQHIARLKSICKDRVERQKRSIKHPINDFLFEYYPFRPAQLLRWSPGVDVVLSGAKASQADWPGEFEDCDGGAFIPAKSFPAHRRDYLDWAIRYLEETGTRSPNWNCFGLHEWAMVYHADVVRHATTPLRLSKSEIAGVVDELGLRCTHYDAYRFFTADALPKNRIALTRATTAQYDQPACIHVVMDLYKFAFKIAPWIASEIIGDAFLHAGKARQIDMRASPYDLQEYGLEAIEIETKAGREEYLECQRQLALEAEPIREEILLAYRFLKLNNSIPSGPITHRPD